MTWEQKREAVLLLSTLAVCRYTKDGVFEVRASEDRTESYLGQGIDEIAAWTNAYWYLRIGLYGLVQKFRIGTL